MRVLLALIAALAAPVAAHAADDGQAVRALSWSAKREVAATVPEPAGEQRPQPLALSGQYLRGRYEAPETAAPPSLPGRYAAAAPPPYVPFTPQVPLPMQQKAMRTASLPANLYAAPASRAAAPVAPPAAPPARALRPAQSPVPPAPVAAAAPQMAPQPMQPAPVRMAAAPPAPRSIGEAPRLYSVHRDYGLAPDAIPEPPAGANRYVLIGPPDGQRASAPKDDDNDDQNDRQPAF